MAYDQKDDFNLSGPTHLVGTIIDWNNAHHRRCIIASLVKGVYTLKSDRTTKRKHLAPPWWNSFHFELSEELHDPCDGSVFGAIFEFKSPLRKCTKSRRLWIRLLCLCSVVVFSLYIFSLIGFKVFLYVSFSLLATLATELLGVTRILNTPDISTRYYINPPRYVIAFRGTSLKPNSMLEDMKLDILYGLGLLHGSDRIKVAKKAVMDTITRKAGAESSVWLAGHSLGAAIALMVGRELIVEHKLRFYLETYLFNPPCIHLPSPILCKSPLLKGAARFFRSLITGAVAAAVSGADESHFTLLSKWIPYIFVHPEDHISSEYIGYFEQREKMDGIGLGFVERLATQNSLASFWPNAKPAHLLPSAYLTTNLSQVEQFRQAHALEQWWAPEFFWESKLCDKFWPVNFEELENGD